MASGPVVEAAVELFLGDGIIRIDAHVAVDAFDQQIVGQYPLDLRGRDGVVTAGRDKGKDAVGRWEMGNERWQRR